VVFLVEDSRVVSFSEFLDRGKAHKLYVKFVFSPDFEGVDEFSVCLIKMEFENYCEIIRYDCSRDEHLHAHHFYRKPPVKTTLGEPLSLETLEKCISDIMENWEKYSEKHFKSRHFSK
jgi:hypothetical protein